jgi:glycosyltransferase involved in cell wall biosynthesis
METQPIRILHVVGAMNRAGIETWLMQVLRNLDRPGFAMDFLVHTTAACAYDPEIRSLGSRLLPCPHPGRPWSYGRRFRRLLREHGPYHVVHSHVHAFSGYVLRLARQAGVPVRIAHSHSTEPLGDGLLRHGYLALMPHWLDRHATVGISASVQARTALFGPAAALDPRQHLLPGGIDLKPFRAPLDAVAVRRELHLPKDALVLGHVGRFVKCKNHGFLMEVAAEVARCHPDTYLLLVGDGPLRRAVEEQASWLGLRERVVCAGARADVPRLLRAMDLFLFPSHYEGLGLAAVEAQAAGLPCLLTDVIPGEATVVPRLVRRLALAEPASAWAEAALAARAEPWPNRRDEALAAVAESPFNIQTSVRELQEIYRRAAVGTAGPAVPPRAATGEPPIATANATGEPPVATPGGVGETVIAD